MLRVDFKKTAKRMYDLIDKDKELYQHKEKEWLKHLASKKKQVVADTIKRSNLPPIEDLTSPVKAKNKEQEKFLSSLRSTSLKSKYRLPYVYGKPGVGKSYLAIRFAYKKIYSGVDSIYFVCLSEFLIKLKDFSDPTKIDSLLDPYILIMDDFCSHNITNYTVELLHAVLDHRLRNKKPTLITSNIATNKIADFMYKSGKRKDVSKVMCEAIEDRIFDLCTLSNLNSGSIRLEKAEERMKKI